MKKLAAAGILSLLVITTYAEVVYCPGTVVKGSKHQALQYVVTTFAQQNECAIGSNCLLNFEGVKYSVAWSKPCFKSAAKGNDPKGSTFICVTGRCQPLGFEAPWADYSEPLKAGNH